MDGYSEIAEVPTPAQPSVFQTGRRPASTPNHPWRFKKGKTSKNGKQEFHPKAIHVLEKPENDQLSEDDSYVPDNLCGE